MWSIQNPTDRENAERLIRAGAPWAYTATTIGIGSEAAVRRHATRHMNPFIRPRRGQYSREVAEYIGAHPEVGAEIAGEQPGGAA